MESDTIRLQEHLQKTVEEKQEAKALQFAYYADLCKLRDENEKLREHVT